jgi:transposase
MDGSTFVGLDVHVATISLAAIRPTGELIEVGRLPNTSAVLAKQLRRLGAPERLAVCYEAGPCGYTIYRQLTGLGIHCAVVAPSLIPTKAGDRVKTDRRDALKLARLLRSGDLTAVGVPTPEGEALRDLSRLREAAVGDLHRARQRLLKSFHRYGVVEPGGSRWTKRWWAWAETVTLAEPVAYLALVALRETITSRQAQLDRITALVTQEAASGPFAATIAALQTLHGVGAITAVGLVAEVGDFTRFDHADQVFAYGGMVASEHSSGSRVVRGPITKTGNAHVRFLAVEAAWHYVTALPATQPAPRTEFERIAQVARERLYRRYWRLVQRGKPKQVAIVAVAREFLGFVWAIATAVAAESAGSAAIAA